MKSLPERIMEHAEATPEATPICPAALLHLGQRAAVGQALSRLARSGRLMRIRQGVYMRPIESRFGRCAPGIEKSPLALSELWGETIVPNGGGPANWLGLTTQNPVRSVYLTSGRSRRLRFGKHPVADVHAPHNVVGARGSEVSLGRFLQDQLVQCQVRHCSLQAPVLALELLQAPCLAHLHPAVLPPPPVVVAKVVRSNRVARRVGGTRQPHSWTVTRWAPCRPLA